MSIPLGFVFAVGVAMAILLTGPLLLFALLVVLAGRRRAGNIEFKRGEL